MIEPPCFHPSHFATFAAACASHRSQPVVGRNPRQWLNRLQRPELSTFLPDRAFDRESLNAFCRNPRHSSVACFVAIMAWGGMRSNHARRALAACDAWRDVLDRLRADTSLDRADAFELLMDLRCRRGLPGVRAAFFTKLIFFLRPSAAGYIMDQWTAKSVNLLCDAAIVELNASGLVTDDNTPAHYVAFCETIDALARAVSASLGAPLDGAAIEERMMSRGGRNPGRWRRHVIRHWRPARMHRSASGVSS